MTTQLKILVSGLEYGLGIVGLIYVPWLVAAIIMIVLVRFLGQYGDQILSD